VKKSKITLLGLGFADESGLTQAAWKWLQTADKIVINQPSHPALLSIGKHCELIEMNNGSSNPSEGLEIDTPIIQARKVIELARQFDEVTFAVAGNPLTDDAVCIALKKLAKEEEIEIRVIEGISLASAITSLLDENLSGAVGWVDAGEVLSDYYPQLNPCQNWLICHLNNQDMAYRLFMKLLAAYPLDFEFSLINPMERQVKHLALGAVPDFKDSDIWGGYTTAYLPAVGTDGSFEAFQDLIAHLRAPDGCPWDREQTHLSLRTHLIEEAYETLDAIDSQQPEALREELGDLLLQIVLHAQIAFENNDFTMLDVLQGIQRKLIYRHPHVFSNVEVEGSGTVLRNWEKLKESEREANGQAAVKGLLDGVPNAMPALSQAQKYQERAARVGFDWDEVNGVVDKLLEEIEEFKSADTDDNRQKEMGDILFSLVNLARWYDIDAEAVLRATNKKFKRRFAYVERKAKENGRNLSEMTLPEMDVFWEQSKQQDE